MWLGAAVLGWTAAKMIARRAAAGADWFTRQPWLRTLLYAVIVGGLVGVPLWRSLTSRGRAQGRSLLRDDRAGSAVFGWLEEHVGMRFDLIED